MLTKFLKSTILLVSVVILFLSSCKEPAEMGVDKYSNQAVVPFFNDTTSIIAFSCKEDSIKTDEGTYNLVGSYKDPFFGTTEAAFAFQVLPTTTTTFNDATTLDSVVLRLYYSASQGNVSTPITLQIHELTEKLNVSNTYYSSHTIQYDATPIANYSFTPEGFISNKTAMPYLQIKLDNALAQKIITLKNDSANFFAGFKGLLVKAVSAIDGSIISFNLKSASTELDIFYNDSLIQRYSVNSQCAYLNMYNHNNYSDANPLLKKQIIDKDTLAGDSLLFIQSMAGVKFKIYFPFIKSWLEKNIAVSNAELVIPIASDDILTYAPPAQLSIFRGSTGFKNLTDISYFSTGGTYNDKTKEYRFTISKYIQDLILGKYTDDGLVIYITNYGINANRAVFKGTKQLNGTRLELKYINQ